MMDRRSFLRIGKAGLLVAAAPAVVRAEILMPVSPVLGWDVPRVLCWKEIEMDFGWRTGIGLSVEYRGELSRNARAVPNDFVTPEHYAMPYPSVRAEAFRQLEVWRHSVARLIQEGFLRAA